MIKTLLTALGVVSLLATPATAYEPTEPTKCEFQLSKLQAQDRLVLEKEEIAEYSRAYTEVMGQEPDPIFTTAEVVMFMEVEAGVVIVTLTKDCQWTNGIISTHNHNEVLAFIENSGI